MHYSDSRNMDSLFILTSRVHPCVCPPTPPSAVFLFPSNTHAHCYLSGVRLRMHISCTLLHKYQTFAVDLLSSFRGDVCFQAAGLHCLSAARNQGRVRAVKWYLQLRLTQCQTLYILIRIPVIPALK